MFVVSRYWNLEIKNAKEKNRKPSLLKAIVKTFGRLYFFVGLFQLILCVVFRLVSVVNRQ
jgi:hypothetical protein